MVLRPLTYVVLMIVTSFAANAEQTLFNKSGDENNTTYRYEWYDHQRQLRSIEFTLNRNSNEALPPPPLNYKPEQALNYVRRELLVKAQQLDPRQGRVSLKRVGQDIELSFHARSEQAIQQLSRQFSQYRKAAFKRYYQKYYLQSYSSSLGVQALKPDHIRYATSYTKLLVPAAQSFYELLAEGSDARDYIDLVLSWLQSIPYNSLSERTTSNGAGFYPPISVLDENIGDCDSKSVLAASLIRAFLPNTPLELVLLPKHALLGVTINPKPEDISLTHEGMELVLIEPTGPAPLPAGRVGIETERAINSKHILFEAIP